MIENPGTWLANDMIGRINQSGLQVEPSPTAEGPYFRYDDGPELFLGRSGFGPLHIAWDTNLLIDYFEHGGALWDGESLPSMVPAEHGEELEGLQLIISLWILRDIRFHILPRVIDDSKRKPLSPARRQKRMRAWEEFCAALVLVDDDDDYPDEDLASWSSPEPVSGLASGDVAAALSFVPEGNDRALVADAHAAGMHVFLTCDKGVLRARAPMADVGLLIVSPLDLIEELGAAGALHCLFGKQYLYWPMPDLQRVPHLINALGSSR